MRRIFILLISGTLAVTVALVLAFLTAGIAAGDPVSSASETPGLPHSVIPVTIPVILQVMITPVLPGQGRLIAAVENTTLVTPLMTTTVPRTSSAAHSTVTTPVARSTPPFPVPTGAAKGDPYTISTIDLATRVHELINKQRAANGLNALGTDAALAGIAANHSGDMAANNYFAHENPAGQDPTARGEAAGYDCRKDYGSYYTYGIAENIYQNNRYSTVTYYSDGRYVYEWTDPETIAQSTVDGWMNSPGHRKNILTATFDREGIGVAIANDDKIYITEDFC